LFQTLEKEKEKKRIFNYKLKPVENFYNFAINKQSLFTQKG